MATSTAEGERDDEKSNKSKLPAIRSTCLHFTPPSLPKMSLLPSFKYYSKLLNPCRSISRLIKLPYRRRRPVTVRALRFRSLRKKRGRKSCWRPGRSSFRSFQISLCRSGQGEEIDKLGTSARLQSMAADKERALAPLSSPITPAYIKIARIRRGNPDGSVDEVEEACRSFENYLMEMIVEEGKVRDLMDVEELLSSWNNLTSPVFMDIVCRFYGELCNDLFSSKIQYETIDEDNV